MNTCWTSTLYGGCTAEGSPTNTYLYGMRVAATSKVGSWDTMAARVCVAATTKVGSIVAEVGTTNVDFIGCVFEPLAFTFSPAVPNHEVGIFTFINRFIVDIHIHNSIQIQCSETCNTVKCS